MKREELCYDLLPVGQLISLACHEVVGDGRLFYRGYSRRKAWFARISAAKSGAKVMSHLIDSVEVACSYELSYFLDVF